MKIKQEDEEGDSDRTLIDDIREDQLYKIRKNGPCYNFYQTSRFTYFH